MLHTSFTAPPIAVRCCLDRVAMIRRFCDQASSSSRIHVFATRGERYKAGLLGSQTLAVSDNPRSRHILWPPQNLASSINEVTVSTDMPPHRRGRGHLGENAKTQQRSKGILRTSQREYQTQLSTRPAASIRCGSRLLFASVLRSASHSEPSGDVRKPISSRSDRCDVR